MTEVIQVTEPYGEPLANPLIGYEWEEEELRDIFVANGFDIIDPYTCYDCAIITDIVQKI